MGRARLSHAAAHKHTYDMCAEVTFSVDVWVRASHTAHGSYQKQKKSFLFPAASVSISRPPGTPVSPRCTGDDGRTLAGSVLL